MGNTRPDVPSIVLSVTFRTASQPTTHPPSVEGFLRSKNAAQVDSERGFSQSSGRIAHNRLVLRDRSCSGSILDRADLLGIRCREVCFATPDVEPTLALIASAFIYIC
jgi:hypothetical protein